MNTLRTLSMMTALGLVTAVSTQALAEQGTAPQARPPAAESQPNATSPNPNAASSPHQRDVTGASGQEAPPTANPDPSGAASPHQRDVAQGAAGATERAAGAEKEMTGKTKPKDKLVGLPVETSSGQQLGSVVDIVRDTAGTPSYAVVAIDNDTTAVPYATATAMIRGDKVVMSQQRLADAPKVKQTEWLDQTSSKWRTESDRYWGNTRTASPNDPQQPKER
jgi:hypothetical protein